MGHSAEVGAFPVKLTGWRLRGTTFRYSASHKVSHSESLAKNWPLTRTDLPVLEDAEAPAACSLRSDQNEAAGSLRGLDRTTRKDRTPTPATRNDRRDRRTRLRHHRTTMINTIRRPTTPPTQLRINPLVAHSPACRAANSMIDCATDGTVDHEVSNSMITARSAGGIGHLHDPGDFRRLWSLSQNRAR